MKKISIGLLMVGLLLLAACSTSTKPEKDIDNVSDDITKEEAVEKEDETLNDKEEIDEEVEQEEASDSEESDKEKDTEVDKQEKKEEKPDKDEANETEKDKGKVDAVENNTDEDAEYQDLIDLGFDIFAAQREDDYSFLTSVLSKGSSLDKKAQVFTFEDVTYPHEQEFIKAKESDIELRYTHEEKAKTVIVGFAVVDYETESSYTIDFQFVKEGNAWKMNDMDINK